MKIKFLKTCIIFVFTMSAFLTSCKKELSQPGDRCDLSGEFRLDEERIAVINDISKIYKEEFSQAIQKFETKSSSFDAESFSVCVIDKFKERINNTENYSIQQKSSSIIAEDTLGVDIQPFLDVLSERISGIEMDENDNKETTLIRINDAIDNYIEEIIADKNIKNSEKQVIIENLIIKGNLLITLLTFEEEFSIEGSSQDIKSTLACGWVCKNRKKIDCTVRSVFAAGICGISVGSIITGSIVVGAFTGVLCYTTVVDAINCWKNI